MSLSKHVDPDHLIKTLRERGHEHRAQHHERHEKHQREGGAVIASEDKSHYAFGSRYQSTFQTPKFKIPKSGCEAENARQLVKSELELDGKPSLNLASFVGTFMEPSADQLVMENIAKNLSDADEYPAMMAISARCVSMISHLWNIPKGETAIGSPTTGSSEAIHLGGLAMKRRWQIKRKAAGKSTEKPNIIMGANAQVALEKFARYFEVEARILDVSEESKFCLDPRKIKENVDENTIGVFIIMGSTYTGHYEPVEEIAKILDEICEESKGEIDIPIHVDGASGAMVAPFTNVDTKWDFRLPRVKSINTSGHKFGLVYAGLGWIIWRNEDQLPKDLIFELNYLGGTEQSYTLNFSRPGAQVIAQYFNFIHLGIEGYSFIMENSLRNARTLSKCLEETGWYWCVSDIHRKKGVMSKEDDASKEVYNGKTASDYNAGLPVVSFHFSKAFKKDYPKVKQASVSILLRGKGWIIPNYPLPPAAQKQEIMRVVVRNSMSLDFIDKLVSDIVSVTETLINSDEVDLESLAKPTSVGVEHLERQFQSMGRSKTDADDLMKSGIHSATC